LSIFLTTKPLTRNQFLVTENALKFTYGDAEFKNVLGYKCQTIVKEMARGEGSGEKVPH